MAGGKDFGIVGGSPLDYIVGGVIDPGGLIYASKGDAVSEYQQERDLGGYGAKPAAAAKAAEVTAKEQKATIATQAAKIEDERKKMQAVADERRARMSKNKLLSGAETGVPGKTSLLGMK